MDNSPSRIVDVPSDITKVIHDLAGDPAFAEIGVYAWRKIALAFAANAAERVREAFQKAADVWTQGEWMKRPSSWPAHERIAAAQYVGDWLRARAEPAKEPT